VTDSTSSPCAGTCMRIDPCKTTPGFDHVCVLTSRFDAGSVLVDRMEERVTCKVEVVI
jgi:hypothetical protein